MQVHVSYLEIYNQTGFDLLDPNREIKAMEDLPQVCVEGGLLECTVLNQSKNCCAQQRQQQDNICWWFSGVNPCLRMF